MPRRYRVLILLLLSLVFGLWRQGYDCRYYDLLDCRTDACTSEKIEEVVGYPLHITAHNLNKIDYWIAKKLPSQPREVYGFWATLTPDLIFGLHISKGFGSVFALAVMCILTPTWLVPLAVISFFVLRKGKATTDKPTPTASATSSTTDVVQ